MNPVLGMSRVRIALLLAVAAIAWGLKKHYAVASVDDLTWVLWPVAKLSAWASGSHFEWAAGEGYLAREQLFLIAKPCTGLNFMIAAFVMVGLLLSSRARTRLAAVIVTGVSLLAAYVVTIFANTVRIVIALWLATHPLATGWWTAARIHRLEGIVVYFGALMLLHELITRTTRGQALVASGNSR